MNVLLLEIYYNAKLLCVKFTMVLEHSVKISNY